MNFVTKTLTDSEIFFNKLKIQPNKGQKSSITHSESVRALSVAGSGKTTAITIRAAYKQFVEGLDAKEIIILTFSRPGRESIETKYKEIQTLYGLADLNNIYTFHAFFKRQLEYKGNKLNLLTDSKLGLYYKEMKIIISDILGKYAQQHLEAFETIRGFQLNAMLDSVVDIQAFIDSKFTLKEYEAILQGYEAFKKENNITDFNDLQVNFLKLLQTDESYRQELQDRFQVWILDEVQDTSRLQYEIIRTILPSDTKKLSVYGDDDQNIYEWRGTDNKIILEMPKYYKRMKTFYLDKNYRCSQSVVNAAKKSIGNNKVREDKQMEGVHTNGKLEIVSFESLTEQTEAIFNSITKWDSLGRPGSYGVLAPVNNDLLILGHKLLLSGMQFNYYGKSSLVTSYPVKVIEMFLKILRVPTNRDLIEKWDFILVSKKERMKGRLQDRVAGLQPFFEVLDARTKVGRELVSNYRESHIELLTLNHDIKKILLRFKDHLIEVLRFDATRVAILNYYIDQLPDDLNYDFFMMTLEQQRKVMYEKDLNVHLDLRTIHSSKGLEFDHLKLLNFTEGNIPYIRGQSLKDDLTSQYVEEQRRLFYVALTRGKGNVEICFNKRRPSRFLAEV